MAMASYATDDLSCGIIMWTQEVSFVLSQITRLTDRQTDSFIATRHLAFNAAREKLWRKVFVEEMSFERRVEERRIDRW